MKTNQVVIALAALLCASQGVRGSLMYEFSGVIDSVDDPEAHWKFVPGDTFTGEFVYGPIAGFEPAVGPNVFISYPRTGRVSIFEWHLAYFVEINGGSVLMLGEGSGEEFYTFSLADTGGAFEIQWSGGVGPGITLLNASITSVNRVPEGGQTWAFLGLAVAGAAVLRSRTQ